MRMTTTITICVRSSLWLGGQECDIVGSGGGTSKVLLLCKVIGTGIIIYLFIRRSDRRFKYLRRNDNNLSLILYRMEQLKLYCLYLLW